MLLLLSELVSTWGTRVCWNGRTGGNWGKKENARKLEIFPSSLARKTHLALHILAQAQAF